MSTTYNPIHILNFLLEPSTEIDVFPNVVGEPLNQLVECNGVDTSYILGKVIKDTGYAQLGSQIRAGKNISSIFFYKKTDYNTYLVSACNNAGDIATGLYYNNAGTWTLISGTETNYPASNVLISSQDFIGFTFLSAYDPATNIRYPTALLNGSTFSTVDANVTGAPKAKYICKYKDRVVLANINDGADKPYRVFYSSVPVSGAISWAVSTNYFDVNFQEEITGMVSNWGKLMVFTRNTCYFVDSALPYYRAAFDVGCINNETLVGFNSYVMWANFDSVFLSTGDRPANVGASIKQLIVNCDKTKMRATNRGEEYELYLGATSANGITYTNCLATYNTRTCFWRWRELADDLKSCCTYVSTALQKQYLVFGNTNGNIMLKSRQDDNVIVYDDNGKEIKASFRTKAMGFDNPDVKKLLKRITTYCKWGGNLKARARIVNQSNELLMPMIDIGYLDEVIKIYDMPLGNNTDGHLIQFEFYEYSKFQGFQFSGMTLLLDQTTFDI